MSSQAIERLSEGMQAHVPDSYVEPYIFNMVRWTGILVTLS
jgi:hypothetical protein